MRRRANDMQHVKVGGTQIAYEVLGQGPPVLLLHGWGKECTHELMMPVARRIQELRTCYVLDFPGFGQSSEPTEAWSVTEYTNAIVEFMDATGIKKADLVAHSFGGRVGLLLAATQPKRVNRVVITGGAGLIPRRGIKYYWRVGLHKLGKRLRAVAWINRALKAAGVDLDARAQNAGSADYREASAQMRQVFVRVVNQNLRPCLARIQAPTLLIWGDRDDATPLYMGQIMEREIADAGLVVFEGGGHFAYLEQIDRFGAVVRHFFGG